MLRPTGKFNILTRDSKFVCPSVCLSVRYVPVLDENGLTYCRSFFSPYGSPITLVSSALNACTNIRRGHPCEGAKYRWGIKISRFSTNKSLYLANDTRYRHSLLRKANRNSYALYQMMPFPMTLNEPYFFKVTALFDANSQTAMAIVTIEGE